MKKSYFPYLPNSRIEDNKRYKYIRDMMEKNPFTYHKRKNVSKSFDINNYHIILDNPNQKQIIQNSNNSNINFIDNSNGNNVNQELLFFQKANDNYIDSYNSFMKQKSSTIENNAQRYLNYITNNKKEFNVNNKQNLLKSNEEYNNNLNNYSPINNEELGKRNSMYENKSTADIKAFPLIKSKEYANRTIEVDKRNFIPSIIKARGSDITNPFFYDCIAKEIIKKNQETMDYNLKESENKFNKNKKLSKYSDDKLAVAPGKINNPKYYNLGESTLDKNPILNKGDYSPSFSINYNYFSRQPNIFDM